MDQADIDRDEGGDAFGDIVLISPGPSGSGRQVKVQYSITSKSR